MIHTQVHPGRGYELRSLDGHSDLWLWVLSLVAPQVIEFTSDGGLEAQEKKCQETAFFLACHVPLPHLLSASAILSLGREARTVRELFSGMRLKLTFWTL